MFDYPLHIPRATSYGLLGLDPEATGEEVREAVSALTNQVRAEILSLNDRLGKVRRSVEGLVEACEEHERLQKPGAEGEAALARQLKTLEDQAVTLEPRYRLWCERLRELEARDLEVSRIPLQDPEGRLNHDRAYPPLELLKLADCAADPFADHRLVLFLLRRELCQFLAEQGEEVGHPTDLTREDFSGDFHPCSLLDGP